MNENDNMRRAGHGLAAIRAGDPDDSVGTYADWRTALVDTLANMMHAADSLGHDFEDALLSARNHYGAERFEANKRGDS